MDRSINHALLSLDFRQNTVTYEGYTLPTGTIDCEVRNIPDGTIEKPESPCNMLSQRLQEMNSDSVDSDSSFLKAALPAVQNKSAAKPRNTPPVC